MIYLNIANIYYLLNDAINADLGMLGELFSIFMLYMYI